MYIVIILEYKDEYEGKLIDRIFREGNESYLVKGGDNPEFPYLSEVELNDYSVFDETDMDAIISELLRVKGEVSSLEDQQHIDDIIRLANKCKEAPNTVLVFAG